MSPTDANLRVTLIGAGANVVLSGVKLLGGIFGHSYALIADAVESLTDIAGSLVIWHAVRVAGKPPDENHPYGHGKAEALAALVVTALLMIAALGIGLQAVRHILSPNGTPEPWTLWILLGIVVIKEIMFQIARARARASESSAMLADAWHHRADAITSLFAGVGICISVFGGPGYERADAIAALLAAGLIFFNALKIGRNPLGELLDEHPEDLVRSVRAVAGEVPGVAGVEKVFARKSGGKYYVDMHLHVPGHLTVTEAHALGGKVKAIIREKIPRVHNVLMHVEPAE